MKTSLFLVCATFLTVSFVPYSKVSPCLGTLKCVEKLLVNHAKSPPGLVVVCILTRLLLEWQWKIDAKAGRLESVPMLLRQETLAGVYSVLSVNLPPVHKSMFSVSRKY
jgi:hypothetical protein